MLLAGLAFTAPTWADDDERDEQEMVREARLAGEIAPLSKLLSIVESDYKGEILKIELEDEDADKWGRDVNGTFFLYEIKILTADGNLVKLKYDAKTLKLLATNRYDSHD